MRAYVSTGIIALLAGAAVAHGLAHEDGPTRAPAPAPFTKTRSPPHFARTFRASRFLRGNVHTHTTRSDGDASPVDVIRWYRDHGYAFLALTDHNALSAAGPLPTGKTPDLTLVPGEEVSMYVHGKQVHVNALCTHATIAGGDFPTVHDALAHAVGETLAQGGVALLNHPNFDWALTPDDVRGAEGAALLEIASGHPYVHTDGDATHPSHEQLWDDALTAGHDLMGVAVDDTHRLVDDGDPDAVPGVAWIELFADEGLDLCDALRRGALYASTGAEIASIDVSRATYEVKAAPDATVVFVGEAGRTLAKAAGDAAWYQVKGDEGYVRARVESTAGKAWTPAVRVLP